MITTHVLDTTRGRPAPGVTVILQSNAGDAWSEVARGETDGDGRLRTLSDGVALRAATYRLIFETGEWYRRLGISTFYPRVEIAFELVDADAHVHVPLLLSPFGYTTYRGS